MKADPDRLSATFAALAHPTRRAILRRLAKGEASVNELAEPFEMSLPGISKHLKVLESVGLISRERRAQWRPCRLEPEPLKDAADWLDRYRKHWEQSFDRLDDYLRELQAKEHGEGSGASGKAGSPKAKGSARPKSGTGKKGKNDGGK